MKTIDIIKELCCLGNTEGCGIFNPSHDEDEVDYTYQFFNAGEKLEIDGDIEKGCKYLYSYSEMLGRNKADVTLTIYTKDGYAECVIFLYKIE